MFHHYDVALNSKGGPTADVIIRAFNVADDSIADMFADESGTPIESLSGIPNAAKSRSDGNYDFFVADGFYNLRFYIGDALINTVRNIQLQNSASVDSVDGKAQAVAVGIAGDAEDLGTLTTPLVDDNLTVKLAFESAGENLRSVASGNLGAGLTGFNPSLSYPVGTMGRSLSLRERCVSDFPYLVTSATDATSATAALNQMIADLPAEGGQIYFPVGSFALNGTISTLGKNVSFRGAGKTATTLTMFHATHDLLEVTGSGSITISDMTFGHGITRTGGAYILFDGGDGVINYGSAVERCTFNGPYIAINAARNSGFTANDCDFVAGVNNYAGIVIDNLTNGDSGDSSINDCYFGQNVAASGAAILQGSSGGLRINNTKVNGYARGYALDLGDIVSFGNTSILIITGSSFENCSDCAIDLQRVAGSAIFTYVLINGNEFAYAPVAIRVTDDADVFYDGIISDNIIAVAGSGTGILMDGGNNWTITDNIIDGVTGTATGIFIGASASKIELGAINFRNVSTPLVDNASDTRYRDRGYKFKVTITPTTTEGALFLGQADVTWPSGIFVNPPFLFMTPASEPGLAGREVYTVSPGLTSRSIQGLATSNSAFIMNVEARGW